MSRAAEALVVGAILRRLDVLDDLVELGIAPDWCTEPVFRAFVRATLDAYQDADPRDVVALREATCRLQGRAPGDAGILAELTDASDAASAAELHDVVDAARSLRNDVHRRRQIETAEHLKRGAEKGDPAALDAALESLEALRMATANRSRRASLAELADRFLDPTDDDLGAVQLLGVPLFDRGIGPLTRGALVYVAARPGEGKTAFAVDVARRFAQADGRVGFVTLEVPPRALFTRFVSSFAGIEAQRLRDARQGRESLSSAELDAVERARSEIGERVFIEHRPGATMQEIRAILSRMVRSDGCRLLVVDHVGLVNVPHAPKEYDAVTYVSPRLKAVAGELDAVLLAPVQLNRSSHDQRTGKRRDVTLVDLRGSGSLEQDADVVVALQRHRLAGVERDQAADGDNPERAAEADENILDVTALKNRDGERGNYAMRWQKWCHRFTETDR